MSFAIFRSDILFYFRVNIFILCLYYFVKFVRRHRHRISDSAYCGRCICAWSVCLSVCMSVCLCAYMYVTLVHPGKAVGRNEMSFGRDVRISQVKLYKAYSHNCDSTIYHTTTIRLRRKKLTCLFSACVELEAAARNTS